MIEWDGRHGELDAGTPDDPGTHSIQEYFLPPVTIIDWNGWGCQPRCHYRADEPHPLLPCVTCNEVSDGMFWTD